MKKKRQGCTPQYYLFVVLLVLFSQLSFLNLKSLSEASDNAALLMLAETIRPEDLRAAFAEKKLSILIVPGHDSTSIGATYRGIKETDLNVDLAHKIFDEFSQDGRYSARISRERDGKVSPWLSEYMKEQGSGISKYIDEKYDSMQVARKAGFEKKSVVGHGKANSSTIQMLYAINKYASESDVDLILHVHFNNYPRKKLNEPGKYSGFSIYVPEGQLGNSRASTEVANALRARLNNIFHESDYPKEDSVVVPDQELIAVGSNSSLTKAVMLVEYGYIYEPQIISTDTRELIFDEMAAQTYSGVTDYFEGIASEKPKFASLLPHIWTDALTVKKSSAADVLSLQAALLSEGYYPPAGKTLKDCPLSGRFGKCTEGAVTLFKKNYVRTDDDGVSSGEAGIDTINVLNDKFGVIN